MAMGDGRLMTMGEGRWQMRRAMAMTTGDDNGDGRWTMTMATGDGRRTMTLAK